MSSEILRRAAAVMRERAEAATPSPWHIEEDQDTGEVFLMGGPFNRYLADVHEWSTGLGNPQHIASWHPAVALAVADWLTTEAAHYARYYPNGHRDGELDTASRHALAVAVAAAYLGPDA